jgi:hypothetical protein
VAPLFIDMKKKGKNKNKNILDLATSKHVPVHVGNVAGARDDGGE